jgi:hypothetical protein
VSTKRIGVGPRAELDRHPRLLTALAAALPVRFEARGPGEHAGLDALITFGQADGPVGADRQAGAAAADGVPTLAFGATERDAPGATRLVATSSGEHLDRPLRDRTLADAHVDGVRGLDPAGAEVLATGSQGPLWTRAGALRRAAAAPLELGPEESLRERLATGRCAALLPLVHLLREVTDEIRWRAPAACAALVLDDPNLHWPSYGFLDLRELVRHAGSHGYHLALATIPLDVRFAHPEVVGLLRRHAAVLSLLVHGNDHTRGELGRPVGEREAIVLAAQALRRVEAFEARAGIPVSRVMAPPHERCSHATVRGLLRCGFDAISMTRPYPWRTADPGSWLAHPGAAGALAGWRPADVVAGGLPVLLRHPLLERDPTELALRAFLGQPLILYGHHGDLSDGLDLLREAAEEVDAVARPRWSSLAEIAAASVETRREGTLLRVRLLARRARVEIPPGVEAVAVEPPPDHDEPAEEVVLVGGEPRSFGSEGGPAAPIDARHSGAVDIVLTRRDAVEPRAVHAPRLRPLTLARRVAGEGRDRALPLVERTRRTRVPRAS